MKTGRTLTQIAIELERQQNSKKDYIADTRGLKLEATPNDGLILQGVNGGMPLKSTAHAQLAGALSIPKPYYDRMMTDAPDLLARNVNTWLEKQPAKKLIRTLDGAVRAVLSNSYRPLDNIELAEAVLPQFEKLDVRVESAEITESRLYLKIVSQKIAAAVKVGDVIQAGAVIGNSEIGHGSLFINALDFRLVCTNGMIRERLLRKAHLGRSTRAGDVLEDAREFFRDETRQADDRAFFLKVRDSVSGMFNQQHFERRILEYTNAAKIAIEADPVKVIDFTAKRFALNDGERSSVLSHLIRGGDLSAWGVANAVTRAAQDVDSYDRSTELEKIGGDVIELPKSAWQIKAERPETIGAV